MSFLLLATAVAGQTWTSQALIAGYEPSTDVSTHAMIDLDAKEIEEFSDAAAWADALFVYENGGGGLCTQADIAAAAPTDSCYGKNTSDAKGNSIKGSGEIRTIAGFATSGREKMSEWPLWNLYRDYWNDDNYADTFIRNALASDGAWSSRSAALRAELSAKGAKYQAVWMYVYHEMEDAVADCLAGDIFDNSASNAAGDSPHAWDEAWAFYAGSLEGIDGSGTGYLLYDLADKRCPQFETCADSGTSLVNDRALAIADVGLARILGGDCSSVAEAVPEFVIEMTIPPLQGLVRYLYLADPVVNQGTCSNNECTYDKAWAEAWAFAAAILPQIDECNATVAQLVRDNTDVDASAPMRDGYQYVKTQLETTYACMRISCAAVGEYVDANGDVYPGMEACVDGSPGLWTKHRIDSSAPFAAEVHAGDVDGDGDLDVVAASYSDDRFAWHDNVDGMGTQWTEGLISHSSDGIGAGPTTTVLCDVDGDGDLDVVAGSIGDFTPGTSYIAWHENTNGDGSAWTEHVVDNTGVAPYSVNCADLDGDGALEILSASYVSGTVEWHRRNGASWTTTTITTDAAGAHSVTTADVKGTGNQDVVVAMATGILWFEYPSWVRHVLVPLGQALDVAAADLDGDGDVDFVTAADADDSINVHINGGSGFWTTTVATVPGAYSVAIADVNNDGRLDFFSCGFESNSVYVHTQNDDATTPFGNSFNSVEISGMTATGVNSVWAADVNMDGFVDVVVALAAGTVEWFENPGAILAGYSPSTDISTHAMIDLDAKEIEELSDAAAWSDALFVYENGGGGLCSADDIANAEETDSCYGKTTSDARGNSIKGSGEIRTIVGFATSGPTKMSEWPLYNMYRAYWDDDLYSDTFIRNALASDGAWSSRSDALRAELSAKGAKYQAVWMYVYHEMEDAVSDCRAGDIFDNQASNEAGDSPHAWDEAWAFYAGSLEGVDGSGTGYLLYDLADKRCPQFGTCASSGTSKVNEEALAIANAGLAKILAADCDGVADERDKFVVQMTIPPLQGLVRYLYLADPVVNDGTCSNNECTYDKAWAEAWAFAAAILPQIDSCDASVAQLVRDNTDVDADAPMKDGYQYVKTQLETTYACMSITCADVGEYQDSEGVVYPGMEACVDAVPGPSKKKKSSSNSATMIIIIVVVVVVVALCAVAAFCLIKRRSGFKDTTATKAEIELGGEEKNVIHEKA